MTEAFFDEDSPMGMELARTLYALPQRRNLIVWAEDDGAGGAQLEIHDGLGVLQCDGTVPRYREKGVQTRLIQARLAMATDAGCDLVTADTAPGSQSQRNYERLGFQVAYSKVTLIKPCF
jgi:GNAT superfamily N-acetyltransferase